MAKLVSTMVKVQFKEYWQNLYAAGRVSWSYDRIPKLDQGRFNRSEKIKRINAELEYDSDAREYYRRVLPFEDSNAWSVERGGLVWVSWLTADQVMNLRMGDLMAGAQSAQIAKDHELTEKDFLLWWHTWENSHARKGSFEFEFPTDPSDCSGDTVFDCLVRLMVQAKCGWHGVDWAQPISGSEHDVPFTEHPVTVKKASEPKKKEQPKMAIESNLSTKLATVKTQATKDAKEALYRTGAKKAVDASRALIVTGLKSKTKGNARAKQIAAFLETDHGRAALSVILGNLPLVMPQLATDPRFTKLAAEMRVAGLQHVTDLLADELAGPVTAIFTSAVAAIPSVADDELQMSRREESHKLVIYIATPIRWLFFGLYDPFLWWAMKRVTNTVRVLVPDVDITRYREAGALVLVIDGERADQLYEAVRLVHTTVVTTVQKIWL